MSQARTTVDHYSISSACRRLLLSFPIDDETPHFLCPCNAYYQHRFARLARASAANPEQKRHARSARGAAFRFAPVAKVAHSFGNTLPHSLELPVGSDPLFQGEQRTCGIPEDQAHGNLAPFKCCWVLRRGFVAFSPSGIWSTRVC